MFPNWTPRRSGKAHLLQCYLKDSGHYLLPIDDFDLPDDQQPYLRQKLQEYINPILGTSTQLPARNNKPNATSVALHADTSISQTPFHTFISAWKSVATPTWQGQCYYPASLTLQHQQKLTGYHNTLGE